MYTVSIETMKDMIKHVSLRLNEPLMIWGKMGAGKSEGAHQAATEENALICDIRLSQYDSVDMRGLPDRAAIEGTTKAMTVWDLPSTIPFVGNPLFPTDQTIMLFLDEINSASPAVAAVAYQLINDRRVGEHVLLPNVRIVAAGNRDIDKGVTNKQPAPLSNRFTHVEADCDVTEVCLHLQSKGVPAVGVAFLQFRKPLLHTFDPTKPDKAFASPRTWEKAFKYLADSQMPLAVRDASIAGAVGSGNAAEFMAFTEVWQNLTPIKQIIADPKGVEIPTEASLRYAMAVNVSGNMKLENIEALHTYIDRFDPEFVMLAWKLATSRDAQLYTSPAFLTMSKKYGAVYR